MRLFRLITVRLDRRTDITVRTIGYECCSVTNGAIHGSPNAVLLTHLTSRSSLHYSILYSVGRKIINLFLSELCQISTKFDNFWRTDGLWPKR